MAPNKEKLFSLAGDKIACLRALLDKANGLLERARVDDAVASAAELLVVPDKPDEATRLLRLEAQRLVASAFEHRAMQAEALPHWRLFLAFAQQQRRPDWSFQANVAMARCYHALVGFETAVSAWGAPGIFQISP